ncbi:uncharacterized protein CDAR_174681 [Caerostris darwini]|uniref:Uncharacterized protein n=1 Tax=Caerostris darwini TaxID=1538125 RepID=A0AAV4WY13_9ARAC|nr:uncharacterized protein CDAR_174681 [Caerostris darwini]
MRLTSQDNPLVGFLKILALFRGCRWRTPRFLGVVATCKVWNERHSNFYDLLSRFARSTDPWFYGLLTGHSGHLNTAPTKENTTPFSKIAPPSAPSSSLLLYFLTIYRALFGAILVQVHLCIKIKTKTILFFRFLSTLTKCVYRSCSFQFMINSFICWRNSTIIFLPFSRFIRFNLGSIHIFVGEIPLLYFFLFQDS